MENDDNHPVLYKCPYCAVGRFRDQGGWVEAIRHIKMKHMNGKRKRNHAICREDREPVVGQREGILFDQEVE